MPIRLPQCAGQPYQPSNGTEGEMFMSQFCQRCKKDNFTEDNPVGGCEILLLTMCLSVDDEGYPKEWKFDDQGCPTCTAFEPDEEKGPC